MQLIVPIKQVKPNPRNPRVIKDEQFDKLCKSITEFPEMLQKRPLVCFTDIDGKYVVLGGNQRLKASQFVGLKELPIILCDDWTEEQKHQFIIKDNVGFGEWDWGVLSEDWSNDQLSDWGLESIDVETKVDYSILDSNDNDDVSSQLEQMKGEVHKSIQIMFQSEHYEEAVEVIEFWKSKNEYIGYMILTYLKLEMQKL